MIQYLPMTANLAQTAFGWLSLAGIVPEAKQNRSYKDFDSGIIARSTYRNYTIAFEATVGEQSEISHVDFEVTDNYSNDKLR